MDINPEKVTRVLATAHENKGDNCPPLPGLPSGKRQPAAVLIPLLQEDQIWKMLFIKRTRHHNDRHSGQIAFPGGRSEPGDASLLQTALREAWEEIGVNPLDIQILGQSRRINTVTHYQVSPFVGILPWPYRLELSPDEVEKTIIIPLEWLNDPQHREIRSWQSPLDSTAEIPVIFFNEYAGEVLWGATARIVLDLLDLLQISN